MNWNQDDLNNIFKIMQLLNDGIGVQAQVSCLQSLRLFSCLFQTWSLIYVFFICIDFFFKNENSSQG